MNEIISAAVLLILIMDPLGNLPIFMSVLKHTEPKRRRAIMVRELLIALLVMLVFLFAGEKILAFLSLRAETVSISGGIILFLIAIKMIFPSASGNSSGLPAGEEPFIVPLAIPLVAGQNQEPGRGALMKERSIPRLVQDADSSAGEPFPHMPPPAHH